ncbi:alpha-L-arabinofuranosidase C-terminal domain-containing protein [Tardisphaera miroshnichenkoae]
MADKADVFVDVNVKTPLSRGIYGQFIEHLGRCIYGGVWVGKDSKIPNVNGYRKDVLDAVKALRPSLVRWPGGNFASGYHWLDGIGRERPRKFDMAWGAEEPNEFGTDEFMEWVRMVGAEPFITVNAGNGSPEEAANWVEYCNSNKSTKYAEMRKKNGHPEPYNVRYWSVGNELWGTWQIGHCLSAEECARRTVEFASEMRMVDRDIKIVAVGGDAWWRGTGDLEWDQEVVKTAGNYIDYLSVHRYINPSSYEELMASPQGIEDMLRAKSAAIQFAKSKYGIKRDIGISFDEWNVWYPVAKPPLHDQGTSVADGVFTGDTLIVLERLSKLVPIATFAQTVNVLPLIVTADDGRMYVNPQYLVFKTFAENSGDVTLVTDVASPHFYSKELDEWVGYVDASATASGPVVYVHAVNKNKEEPIELAIHLNREFASATHLTVSGESENDRNSFEEPNKVMVEEEKDVKVEGQIARVTLRPHSANAIAFS